MLVEVLVAKIRFAEVTAASMHYKGSITIDQDILDELGVVPYMSADVNLMGEDGYGRPFRGRTYILPGPRGTRCVEANGALAYHVSKGDIVHVNIFGYVSMEAAKDHKPIIIESNK
jgi:aspartate 1-decarboxylase